MNACGCCKSDGSTGEAFIIVSFNHHRIVLRQYNKCQLYLSTLNVGVRPASRCLAEIQSAAVNIVKIDVDMTTRRP